VCYIAYGNRYVGCKNVCSPEVLKMSTQRFLSLALVLSLVALFSVGPLALAQEVTANIVGTVTDSSGAPMSDANVVATETQRGIGADATEPTARRSSV